MELDDDLTPKQERIKRAVQLRHGEGLTHEEIAEQMELRRRTITGYLNSDTAKQFRRYFGKRERHELKAWLEDRIKRDEARARDVLKELTQGYDDTGSEVKPQDRIRAAKELLRMDERLVDMFADLGLIDKVAEKYEHTVDKRQIVVNAPEPGTGEWDGLVVEREDA